ncbi:MAG: phosphotransferase, partial [Chloroflexota bacterium]
MEAQRRRGGMVGKGNTAEVVRWSRTTVVKLLRPGIPAEWAGQEAAVLAAVRAAGLPAPAVDGVVDVDGRAGIVLERIVGIPMWDRMKAAPDELAELTEALARLQDTIHAAGPLPGIPPLAARVRDRIARAPLAPDERAAATSLLATLPAGGALCHGDMHPANVLLTDRGPVVIDWFDAATGDPAADRARSALLMRPLASARSARPFLAGATRPFLARLHDAVPDGGRAEARDD